ncbi:F-box/LRR-repeat protein At3g48880-like isoform X2 [Actinidia eriantha]|uniref:F-box/LRR-repeat protein At3g48880-like isoform X2 n=1 Tax=Actinidia eriantha TaxID=165200 RepID=UPI00258E69CE|nr:F-box/LRR-repeat protein At3g48880-like isoform X2 [Actinidia eriantha]
MNSEMSEPKWEELDMDCLVNIFGRLGLESLVLDVLFVCKSWYRATLNPEFWWHLDFSKLKLHDSLSYDDFTSRLMSTYQIVGNFPITAFIKSVVKRSDRSVTYIALPDYCTEEALLYVADECPALRTLVLPSNVLQGPQFKIQNHMSKWTSLQSLKLQRCFDMEELLTQISIHCKSFVALAIETANIGKDEASAIVNFLPNIKVLVLRDCTGFTESDEEILKHASRIRSFKHEGSMGSMSFYFSYRSVDGFRW